MAFYGLFRIGELAAKNANSGGSISVAQLSAMRFLTLEGNIHMLKITIPNFKYNTDKRPFVILIDREDSLPFCPVQAMWIIANSGASKWALFFVIATQAQ